MTVNWEERAAEKRESVQSLIPAEWKVPQEILAKYSEQSTASVLDVPKELMKEEAYDITQNYSACELHGKIVEGKLTSTEVVLAFMQRVSIASQLTNCTTEIMFEYGLKRAQFLDEYFKKHGKPIGPLHGIPFSLKDSFNVPGYDSTLGVVAMIDNKPKNQSDIVTTLLDLGAVFYVKSNIPLTLMTADSENHIFGRTLNPNNLSLTSGGSSGGEGSLIRQRGALIGVGTDIAGSIRIPSLCNGVYGLKPTTGRMPLGNQMVGGRDDHIGLVADLGPLCNSFDDMKFFMKYVIGTKPWEKYSDCINMPWNEIEPCKRRLNIGVVIDDKKMPVHPPIKRIIQDACETLKKYGHNIVTIDDHPSYYDAWGYCLQNYMIDPMEDPTMKKIEESGQPPIKSMSQQGLEMYDLSPLDLNSLIELKTKIKEISESWFNIFLDNKLDILICPGNCSTAPPHDTYGIPPYTAMWNLVNYPACIIPYGKFDEDLDTQCEDFKVPDYLSGFYATYDEPSKFKGGVGHLQLVSVPYTEEKLLEYGSIIDNALNF